MRPHRILVCCAAVLACAAAVRAEERAINLESLLGEMIDPGAVARWPDPPYTCRQASSYDRRSKTPDDPGGWFANTDNMDGSGDSLRWETIGGRRECVLMDGDGPGAVVRFWTGGQPPKGTLRFYLDGAQQPAIEAPLYDLLAGKSFVPRPLAIENAGAAGNLYLPVPYARHCKITYDEAKPGNPNAPPPGRWYNIEYRTYPAGTAVTTFAMDDFKALDATVARVCQTLLSPEPAEGQWSASPEGGIRRIDPGREVSIDLPPGPGAVRLLLVSVEGDGDEKIRVDGERFPSHFGTGSEDYYGYGTKSWDYGILRFSVNGKPAEKDYDAYSKQSMASGPVELGTFDPKDAQMVLRVEVVGANPASKGTKSYFGLDAVVLSNP